jgi:hypothetical protein
MSRTFFQRIYPFLQTLIEMHANYLRSFLCNANCFEKMDGSVRCSFDVQHPYSPAQAQIF